MRRALATIACVAACRGPVSPDNADKTEGSARSCFFRANPGATAPMLPFVCGECMFVLFQHGKHPAQHTPYWLQANRVAAAANADQCRIRRRETG